MRYEDWAYHPSRLPEDKFEREKAIEALQEKFLEELRQNPKVEAFLRPYRPSSTQDFLKRYAFRKRLIVAHSDYRMRQAEKRELRRRDETESVYNAILQKKLFNLELLWRAAQISLPGIDTTGDFYKWYRQPKRCTFIEPVTKEEIAVMQNFLQTDECELERYGDKLGIHSSSDIFYEKEKSGEWNAMPEWFSYYDTYMATGHLLLLPDVKGQKERYYRDLYFKEDREKNPEKYAIKQPPGEDRPYLNSFSAEKHYELSRLVDDEIFQHLFYHEWQEEADKERAEEAAGVYDAEDYVTYLSNIPDPPPVRGGVSWREALHYCWMDYLKRIIREDLPLYWEEQMFYLETGLAPAEEEVDPVGIEKMFREQILRGRELCGEPRDFDY